MIVGRILTKYVRWKCKGTYEVIKGTWESWDVTVQERGKLLEGTWEGIQEELGKDRGKELGK